jgi:uncharacterized protein YceK
MNKVILAIALTVCSGCALVESLRGGDQSLPSLLQSTATVLRPLTANECRVYCAENPEACAIMEAAASTLESQAKACREGVLAVAP